MTNFIDYVKIYCRSGKGGAGCMHLHRAKYLPKGGPDGGDGGKGGSIILRGNRNLWTLLHLKYQKHIMATDGGKGGQSRSFGKDGEDKIIEVPCGTVVYDGETGEFICEVKEHNEQVVLLKGGFPECRQIDLTQRRFGCQTRDSGLSVHNAHAATRYRLLSRRPVFLHGRHPRYH